MATKLIQLFALLTLAACTGKAKSTVITVRGDFGEEPPTFLKASWSGDFIQEAASLTDSTITFVIDTTDIYVDIDRTKDQPGSPVCMFIADGTPVEITLTGGKGEITKGSEQNMRLAQIYRMQEDLEGDPSIWSEKLYAQQAATRKRVLAENADNLVPVFLLWRYGRYYIWDGIEALDSFWNNYKYRNHPQIERMRLRIEGEHNRQPGSEVVDFVGQDLEGNDCLLRELVEGGKYVLLDFWASWCGPCKAEIPDIKDCYLKYREKGFGVVGISLDTKQEAWAESVKELGIDWPQMSDLKGWNSDVVLKYDIWGIPMTLLYGPDGKLVARDLHGEKLQQALADIFGE